jgi:hypothetical protein
MHGTAMKIPVFIRFQETSAFFTTSVLSQIDSSLERLICTPPLIPA